MRCVEETNWPGYGSDGRAVEGTQESRRETAEVIHGYAGLAADGEMEESSR